MRELLTYQRPCCAGAIQVDDSAEVVVECDVDVQTTNDAILISKGLALWSSNLQSPSLEEIIVIFLPGFLSLFSFQILRWFSKASVFIHHS
jgi:hypothetical protein